MNGMRTTILAISAALLVATLAGATAKPALDEDEDKLVLANDHVRVWFQGKKPMLKVFPADAADEENATGAFGYKFREIVEYNDVDGDGLPAKNEVVASLDLDRASTWSVAREVGEDNVTLTLTLVAPVRLGKDLGLPTDNATGNATSDVTLPGRDVPANVSIVFRIFETETTIDNVTVPETAVKYDLVVASWPFVNAELNRLALEIKVTGDLEVDEEGEATVEANGTAVGALTWVTTAVGNTTEGETIDVPVEVATAGDDEGSTRLVFTYDAPRLASLVHDPTVGTTGGAGYETGGPTGTDGGESTGSGVPGPAFALVVAGIAAAAFGLRRRA